MPGRYLCDKCTGRFETAGDCPNCKPEEVLIDLEDPVAVQFLRDQDDARARRRYALFVSIGLLPAFGMFVLTIGYVGWIAAMLLGAFAAMGCAFVLQKIFPAARKTPPTL